MTILEMKTQDLELLEEIEKERKLAEDNLGMAKFTANAGNDILAQIYLGQVSAHLTRVAQLELILNAHLEILREVIEAIRA